MDRRFKGVGRLRISLGTDSLREFKYRQALIDAYYKAGKLDVLRALKAKQLSVEELLNAEGKGTVERPYFARTTPRRQSFVYVIAAERANRVKIGLSCDPERRLAHMQIASPLRLRLLAKVSGGRKEELAVHRRFARFRLDGEWFMETAEIREWVAELGRPSVGEPSLTVRPVTAAALTAGAS